MKTKRKNKLIFFILILLSVFFGVLKNTQAAGTLKGGEICEPLESTVDAEKKCQEGCASGVGRKEYSSATDGSFIAWICVGNAPVQAATPEVTKHFDYTLLESFPGFFQAKDTMTDLPTMILAIYKFGIWTVGIAGFFMLVVGGFMYIASAGNTSAAGSAKGIILDAILGIVAALGAYVILYVINPELTRINISFTKVNVEELKKAAENRAKCTAGTGLCDKSKMTIFGDKADQAAHICQGESGGKVPSANHSLDKCKDGNIFSAGLFQINLIANGGSFGLNCGNLFDVVGKGIQGDCLKYLDKDKRGLLPIPQNIIFQKHCKNPIFTV